MQTMNTLHDDCRAVMEASNQEAFRHTLQGFARRLGFDLVSATTVVDQADGRPAFFTVHNVPVGYLDTFVDPSAGRRDPVMQHCKHRGVPLVWGPDTYLAGGAMDLWETQAAFGYKHGIAVSLHLPKGRHFFAGVDRDAPLPTDPQELARIAAELQLFATHAQDAATRLMLFEPAYTELPHLTARELDVLRWTMDGQTARQVGARLAITERTVNMHSRNVIKKLGCLSKHQAVLKALQLGLLR
jgi:DNA-binding CsgD family transcriptional regulator